MKIYTKTGDDGKTSLFGGSRVNKNNKRINAYGTIDELNSILGLVLCEDASIKAKELLFVLQNTLFVLGGELATPKDVKSKVIKNINDSDIEFLEKCIDEFEKELEPLRNFILPGGNRSASLLHFARTVCRRAERNIVDIETTENLNNKILVYVNRLSDLLFTLARYENHVKSTPEIEWKPRG